MDGKKKNFLENFRLKAKLLNLKKPGRKALAKQGRNLAHRRSISVPDLRLVPGEAFSTENALVFNDSDTISSIGISPRLSDTDSIASGSIVDGPSFTVPEITPLEDSETTLRVPTDRSAAAVNRKSAPVETLGLYEEISDTMNSGSENKVNLYAQVNKRAHVSKFTFDPIPAPRSVLSNAQVLSPRPDLAERESLSGEDAPAERVVSGSLAAALARANSLGEQMSPYVERRTTSFEQRNPSSEKGNPPTKRQTVPPDSMPLTLDTMGVPLENADGTSLDSACGTPSEERVNLPWTTDSEELDREPWSPFSRDFSTEEALLEEAQHEEALDEIAALSSEQLDFFDENSQDPLESSMTTGPEGPTPLPCQRYLLNINLKRGKNLVIRDKRSGTSDPYVKFKLEGKQFYKSKVVYKSLNPRWNESFSHPLRDRAHAVEVRVYDKNRTSDDFMGSGSVSLRNLQLYKTYEMELPLNDPKSKEDDMGVIIVEVCLMFRDATIKRSPRWPVKKNKQNQATPSQRPAEPQKKNQMWTGVLGITLVEGQDLPQYGHGDIYVRFRLGDQKYKSKNLCIQANPQWREQFDFNQFEDNQEPLQVEVLSKRGRKGEESWGMFEIDLSRLSLNERQLYTHVLDPGKGRLVFLVTLRPCWGVSITDIETAPLEKPDEKDTIADRFSLKNSHKCVGEVGFLQVKVIKANDLPPTDLNGKSNSFCVIELGNSKLQTHTVYKSVNPEWNKVVTFPIKDIHDVVELTVLDENGDKTPNFLGKVAIPLLSVQNGQQICLLLKKEHLGSASKGTITLVLDILYNKVRAGIRTFQPKETKLIEENVKFSKKVLAQNIYRVRKISTAVLYTLQYIKSCFQWESTQRSLIAFLIFLVTVWHFELFMLPLFLLLLVGWNYFQLTTGKASSNQDLVNMSMGDEEEEDEKESGKKGLMDKIHMVQEVVLVVQNVLEELANTGERIKNIFNWSVPFMSCLACLVLFVSTALLYFIPLRYIVLIWGVNKFTKKLRNPYAIDNNEILDFLKRVPSDVQKVQYSALRAPTSQSQQRKKR
ncbi:multiple C2 and transmembrane domain-containing protein 2 isoform X1 [Lates calcarifer]|uniref:Multiple C2 and transmembrane domain-containing protein 2 isoform X1 n=1 Tax=Lates calcarifer TaxID=8187 RepID=A0A4W6CP67_LATCA|nr:multiple C2 and transmembrane domain-containing protein 2 isoform X1 [Lates calcarifer]XP_050929341.1 multiple C2 and transmembrane domain-containing protein 2 isoform X1 [Lates calcarifer]XP_050929342.1 multiple C2 and transmembrane domain-containing protein 2 isoform X1 [Lates calcarifer]XP_050929343.1 multiple C2 and transmembrane domain-containing protein 2 isoform X1 [Lates calcarifer]